MKATIKYKYRQIGDSPLTKERECTLSLVDWDLDLLDSVLRDLQDNSYDIISVVMEVDE